MTTTAAATATTPAPSGRTTTDSLHTTLDLDFRTACGEFTQAREQQERKDTPAHRAEVAESMSRIDSLLDMYLETCAAR